MGILGNLGGLFKHGEGEDGSSLLFFFLLLVVIFCNSGCFDEDNDSLLFFFLLLVILFCSGCGDTLGERKC